VQGWLNRGWTLVQLGRWDEALVSFDKETELNPNDTVAWSNRGAALGNLGHFDDALASCDRAIELDPNNAPAWYLRGLVLSALGRYDEALVSFDKAIDDNWPPSRVFFKRAEVLLALNRWDEGGAAIDDALRRFAHADEPDVGDTTAIVRNLFADSRDEATWRARIMKLLELYDKYEVLSSLGQGLVGSISALTSPTVSDATARMWRDVWRELADSRKEFELPLRLLDAAVRYRETHDQRVLLELPIEERKLLAPLLEQPQTASSAVPG